MHTVVVLGIGLSLLGLFLFGGSMVAGAAGMPPAALSFVPLWLVGAGINMYLGVRRAGYSVADEAPVFLVVFAIPASAALVTWWKLRG